MRPLSTRSRVPEPRALDFVQRVRAAKSSSTKRKLDTTMGNTIPPVPAIAKWEGDYTTTTQWWGTFFSPVIVYADGSVEIAGTMIESPRFDPASNTMSFDPVNIIVNGTATTARGSLTFTASGASGTIYPRPQDGAVPWSAAAKCPSRPGHPRECGLGCWSFRRRGYLQPEGSEWALRRRWLWGSTHRQY